MINYKNINILNFASNAILNQHELTYNLKNKKRLTSPEIQYKHYSPYPILIFQFDSHLINFSLFITINIF